MVSSGRAAIGTPDDAIAQIEKLEQKQGHFGAFLLLAHNWAPFDATKKSYELFARHVLPKFNGANFGREGSLRWVAEHSGEFMGAAVNAAMATIQKHVAEAGRKQP
jgi:limonene 1,2-monooxygenase